MSLFNPWVLLGILLAVVGSFGGGYLKGSNDEVTRQQLEIAALNAEARQKEQALITAIPYINNPDSINQTSESKPRCETCSTKAQC